MPEQTTPPTIHVDGHPVAFQPGQTLAAVLIADGQRAWRTTRVADRPRGIFCGIGICFDCLVVLNDRPNVRACITRAEPGDVVTSQTGTGHG